MSEDTVTNPAARNAGSERSNVRVYEGRYGRTDPSVWAVRVFRRHPAFH